jgi:hypothetical protein
LHTKKLAEMSFGQRPSLATETKLTVPDSAATAAPAPLSLNSVKRLVSFPLRLLPQQSLADTALLVFGWITISKSAFLFYCLPSFADTEPETMFQAAQQHGRNQQNALFRRRFYFGYSVSDLTIDRRHL